jgi:hypothetical protein
MDAFQAKRFLYSCSLPVAASPGEIFPLLCPTREYEWIDGWDCRLVYSESGLAEEGCVFTTDMPGEGPTVWVTTLHDRQARRVEFIRVTPDVKVLKMQLKVDASGREASLLRIRYTLTALGEKGNDLVDHLTAAGGGALAARAQELGILLNHFLATGSMLRKTGAPA